MAEQNLQSWSLDTSPPSPQIAAFLIKAPFFFTDTWLWNYWFMSGKQLNLVTMCGKMSEDLVYKKFKEANAFRN